MNLSKLIGNLQELLEEHGDINVILQADQEGNYYESLRGAEFTYYDGDQDTVDDLEEAEEGGYHPVIVVYP